VSQNDNRCAHALLPRATNDQKRWCADKTLDFLHVTCWGTVDRDRSNHADIFRRSRARFRHLSENSPPSESGGKTSTKAFSFHGALSMSLIISLILATTDIQARASAISPASWASMARSSQSFASIVNFSMRITPPPSRAGGRSQIQTRLESALECGR